MRKIVITAFAAASFAAALPASAETAATTGNAHGEASAQQQRTRQAGERQVCVSEQLSDSRMRRRVCRTAREWQELHGDDSAAR